MRHKLSRLNVVKQFDLKTDAFALELERIDVLFEIYMTIKKDFEASLCLIS